jgi:predicted nucleic acid-binding protein
LVIEAAIVAKADAIVSGDRQLLQLGSVEVIAILSPHQFLDRLTCDA